QERQTLRWPMRTREKIMAQQWSVALSLSTWLALEGPHMSSRAAREVLALLDRLAGDLPHGGIPFGTIAAEEVMIFAKLGMLGGPFRLTATPHLIHGRQK